MWKKLISLISPRYFFDFSGKVLPWLQILFLCLLTYSLIAALYFVPPDYIQGDAFRILYIHAPCAFLSLFIYLCLATASALNIIYRLTLAEIFIKKSIPMGAMFTALALMTGSIWGKPMWGTWWLWDARLTSELVLLFIYLGLYFVDHALSEKKQDLRAVSILILVGFVDIPIIHYSVTWWNTLHQGPTLRLFSPSTIDRSMIYPLITMMISFMLYYSILVMIAMRTTLIKNKKV